MERRALAVGETAAVQHRRLLRDRPDQLAGKPRLSDPGGSGDGDGTKGTLAHRGCQCVTQHGKLQSTPDKRSVEAAWQRRGAGDQLVETECPHRLPQPAELELSQLVEPACAHREPPGELVDGDLARRNLLLQTRRDVHRRTGGERIAGAAAGQHLSRRETDTNLEPDAELALEGFVEPGHCAARRLRARPACRRPP